MTNTPDYYEQTAAEFSRRTGIDIDAAFVARTEQICNKPFNGVTPDDLDHANAVIAAEVEIEAAAVKQADEWTLNRPGSGGGSGYWISTRGWSVLLGSVERWLRTRRAAGRCSGRAAALCCASAPSQGGQLDVIDGLPGAVRAGP